MYWRLSGFYLFYFAALGALWPYWGPYLKTLGFTETEIGQLVAIIMATKIVAPYLTCNIIIFVNKIVIRKHQPKRWIPLQ